MSSQWGSHYGFQPPSSLAQVPGLRSGEATDDELRHIQAGTVDRLPLTAKLRLSDPANWLRLRIDVCHLVTEIRGTEFVRSRKRLGEQLMLLVVRAMCSLHMTTLSYIFTCISEYLYRKMDIDILSSEITLKLPRQVSLGRYYTVADLYFVCCALERDMFAFLDGYEFLEVEVTTIRPLSPVGPNADESLSRLSHLV